MTAMLLTRKGRKILISNEDLEWAQRFSWCIHTHGRVITSFRVRGKSYHRFLHQCVVRDRGNRYVMHRDGDFLNNQRENLRFASDR